MRSRTAPTWSPQSSQEKWSHPGDGCNLHKARPEKSFRAIRRVMPKTYGTRTRDLQCTSHVRHEGIDRPVSSRRTDLGPSRRDPQGTLHAHGGGRGAVDDHNHLPEGASATGSSPAAHRRSCGQSGRPLCRHQSPARASRESVTCPVPVTLEVGVGAFTAPTHANRAVTRIPRDAAQLHRRGPAPRRCLGKTAVPTSQEVTG